jgi:DNA repair exonuclease SbcCD nuclease subunit
MSNLFKKVAAFTDIHLGLKSGSRIHNQDCEDFIIWFIEQAQKNNCETCIFLGDWHNNRSTIDVSTMNYTVSNLERLNNSFEKVYMIMGNHDEFYKDKREIHSLEFARLFPNITIVNKPFTQGNVTILPWLVGDEWKTIRNIQSRYVFAHLELPRFYMNAMVQMPDHGLLQSSDFCNQEYVFSGHFHKRQIDKNIVYIGNTFPHNFADAGDDDRGMMIFEWGGKPQFMSWPDQPVYRVYRLSEVIDNPDQLLKPKMHCRVVLDISISFEEANFIKETLIPQYQLRDLILIPEKTDEENIKDATCLEFKSVDTIVLKQLESIDSDNYDKKILMDIYQNL